MAFLNELNLLTENYNYAKHSVEQANKLADINGYMLTLIDETHEMDVGHLNMFNGPVF